MTSPRASYSHLFSFLLPPGARADSSVVKDSPYRCFVDVRSRLVNVMGPSREAVLDQAARILTAACEGLPAQCIAGTMYHNPYTQLSEGRDWLRLPGPVDNWSIAVNAPVAFSPTGLGHEIPDLTKQARPALAVIDPLRQSASAASGDRRP